MEDSMRAGSTYKINMIVQTEMQSLQRMFQDEVRKVHDDIMEKPLNLA
jgi:hypothetical protein